MLFHRNDPAFLQLQDRLRKRFLNESEPKFRPSPKHYFELGWKRQTKKNIGGTLSTRSGSTDKEANPYERRRTDSTKDVRLTKKFNIIALRKM